MTNERACANDIGLEKRTVEPPTGPYSFYPEAGADFTTSEGRIAWFSANFEVDPPKLTYDEDEPDQILLTDELLEWVKAVGGSLDWLFCGKVGPALTEYRKRHMPPAKGSMLDLVGKLDDTEQKILLAGLNIAAESNLDQDEIINLTFQKIREYRNGARRV